VAQSLASGAIEGAAGLFDLPGVAFNAAGRGAVGLLERGAGALGMEAPQFFEGVRDALSSGPMGSGSTVREGASTLTGGFSERQPQTTAGEYARTVGTFLPGAALGGGGAVSNILRYGVLPGLASEAAGQATEGMSVAGVPVEPFARAGAALVAPSVAGRLVSPFGGADAGRVQSADTLRRAGVDVRAGERVGSATLRRMEGSVEPTPQQLEQFTGAAMRTIGSTAPRATPDALRAAEAQIVRQMDDVLSGVSVQVTPSIAQRAVQVADDYMLSAPSGSVVPRVRVIVDELVDAATSPNAQPISLERLRQWRSALGQMTQSSDEATRGAAMGLRRLIDDATDNALLLAGRTGDAQRLAESRTQYRNLLAIQDAASRAGAEGGVLSPTALNQGIIRTQGRQTYAMGRGTDLSSLSRSGAEVLRPMPTVEAGGARTLPQLTQGGLMAGGAAAGYQMGGMPGAVLGGAIGTGAVPAAQSLIGTGPIQAYLRNQAMQPAAPLLSPQRAGVVSGLLAQ
jgi:hypothetical protein